MPTVESPNDIPNLYPPIFDPQTQSQEIQEYLRTEGFVAVQVTSAKEAQARYSEFWSFLENLDSGISRHDPSTWDKHNSWPEQRHGIIFGLGVGHADFAWKARIEPNVLKVFAELWEVPESKLLVSFDGANMYPNPRYAFNAEGEGLDHEMKTETIKIRPGYAEEEDEESRDVIVNVAVANEAPLLDSSVQTEDKLGLVHKSGTYRMWPHRDQKPSQQGRICVQGLYNMIPNTGPQDGGLVVYPRSHTIDWTKHDPRAMGIGNWYVMPKDAPQIQPSNAAVVRTPAGCLILWDSRLAHCNRPPTDKGRTRAASYICMLPKGNATKGDLTQRQKLYTNFRTTTHWPYPVVDNGDDLSYGAINAGLVKQKLLIQKPFGRDDSVVRNLVGYEERSLSSFWKK
ncbi:hypothetical protein BGZ49_007303 [Haplosporangium sp. Z 27]|nr:hypothetical protein BGZ49_007303 [Haplosporangium sp. Z 27]